MAEDLDFFLRLGRIGDRGASNAGRGRSFVTEVLSASRRSGQGALDLKGRGRYRRSGRGRHATRPPRTFNRRVIVKARIVRHRGDRYTAAPLAMHLRYLRREGVTRDGSVAEMFDRDGTADHAAFAQRCEDDRHHFRFIVSPEDAASLANLRATTRELMVQAEADLGTKLDWVAVDHWNTDNPHVHILIRGVGDDGRDLVIDPDYMTRGLRQRAEAMVSLELGPRTPEELAASLDREIKADRWTTLDRALQKQIGDDGLVDLRPEASGQQRVPQRLIGRVQHLQRLGLADDHDGRWRLIEDLEPRLRALGERGDIIKTLHRAFRDADRDVADLQIQTQDLPAPIVGRLVDRGLHDELNGRAYVVVDGVDGRLHHFRFRDLSATGDTPVGGLVEIRSRRIEGDKPVLDLVHRADLSIGQQVQASGATWLDRQLVVRDPAPLADQGFGREVREALEQRRAHLQAKSLADRHGRPRAGLIANLRAAELARVADNIAAETGSTWGQASSGDGIAGVYRRRMDLVSGRFAMIQDGLGFQLVPWTRSLEERLGQEVKGIMSPGGGIDWAFGRKRGIGL
jgi:type IV secretory pathway VirD2 relaxase